VQQLKGELVKVGEEGVATAARLTGTLRAVEAQLSQVTSAVASTSTSLAAASTQVAAAKAKLIQQAHAQQQAHIAQVAQVKQEVAAAKAKHAVEMAALRSKLEAIAAKNSLLGTLPGPRVAYAIDFSGSMDACGAYSQASTYLREALDIHMQLHQSGDAEQLVGVVCFAEQPTYVCGRQLQPATLGHVQALSSGLPPGPDGGTSIMEGLTAAARMTPVPLEIFLLTDCEGTVSEAQIAAVFQGKVHLRYVETHSNRGSVANLRKQMEGILLPRGGSVRTCVLRK
jgi:hypothetical protein